MPKKSPTEDERSFLIGANDEGELVFLYSDEIAFLLDLGPSEIHRASHVEPAPDGGWTADLTPSGGHVLGPFTLRQEALDAEVAYLEERLF